MRFLSDSSVGACIIAALKMPLKSDLSDDVSAIALAKAEASSDTLSDPTGQSPAGSLTLHHGGESESTSWRSGPRVSDVFETLGRIYFRTRPIIAGLLA